MIPTIPFKRLILRAVLRQVSPMVIRLISVPDDLELPKFHNLMRAILGWEGDLGYIVRVHGQDLNSFRRKTRSKALHEFKLHRQEKFLYICDTLHMWKWDVRVVDIQEGAEDDHTAICLGGRGAAPPEFCGGPTGYRLMMKRQRREIELCNPGLREAGIQLLAKACPEEPTGTWDLIRTTLEEGLRSIDRQLEESGPLESERFNVMEANQRLAALQQRSFRS